MNVTDGIAWDSDTFIVTVMPINDAPVITSTVDASRVRYQAYAIDRVTGDVEDRNRQLGTPFNRELREIREQNR